MTHFLVSDENPDGFKLEEILHNIRKDIIHRCTKILDDETPSARHVIDNNMKILGLLSDAINIAEDSTQTLNKAFGPPKPGEPRIGEP